MSTNEATKPGEQTGGDNRDGSTRQRVGLDQLLAEVERKAIIQALRDSGGNRSLAAQLMSISRSRLYRRMDALGIKQRKEVFCLSDRSEEVKQQSCPARDERRICTG